MIENIAIDKIVIYPEQRSLNPKQVANIRTKIRERGYNISYPITLDQFGGLVDGGHRLEAAKLEGLKDLPCLYLPEGVSPIKHAILCNEDGADTRKYDVFDYAELCYTLAAKGRNGESIAQELGWQPPQVSKHIAIKTKLHPIAWRIAKGQFPKFSESGNDNNNGIGNQEFPIGNWRETHFRSVLSYLSLNGSRDNATMRGQRAVIESALTRWRNGNPKEKVTADWLGELAAKQAWYIKLKRYAITNLKNWAKLETRKQLFASINRGNFGDSEDDIAFDRFTKAVEALNGKSPLLLVGHCEKLPEQIKPESVDVIITSPPYNLGSKQWDMGGWTITKNRGTQPRNPVSRRTAIR